MVQVGEDNSQWNMLSHRTNHLTLQRLKYRPTVRDARHRAPARPVGGAAAQGGQGAAPAGAAGRRQAQLGQAAERGAGSLRPARPAAGPLAPRRRQAALARPRRLRAIAPRAGGPDRLTGSSLDPDEVVRRLGLMPHPEGGFYRET